MIPPRISAVVARSRNGVIGRDGDLPWRLSTDLKHFKQLTMGKPCVMGRKTWESLPGVLPGRPHLILTRDTEYEASGAEVFHNVRAVTARAAELAGRSGQSEIMIIGGAEIYRLYRRFLDRVYLTVVEAEVEGDAIFPDLDSDQWAVAEMKSFSAGPRDDYDFVTQTVDRIGT